MGFLRNLFPGMVRGLMNRGMARSPGLGGFFGKFLRNQRNRRGLFNPSGRLGFSRGFMSNPVDLNNINFLNRLRQSPTPLLPGLMPGMGDDQLTDEPLNPFPDMPQMPAIETSDMQMFINPLTGQQETGSSTRMRFLNDLKAYFDANPGAQDYYNQSQGQTSRAPMPVPTPISPIPGSGFTSGSIPIPPGGFDRGPAPIRVGGPVLPVVPPTRTTIPGVGPAPEPAPIDMDLFLGDTRNPVVPGVNPPRSDIMPPGELPKQPPVLGPAPSMPPRGSAPLPKPVFGSGMGMPNYLSPNQPAKTVVGMYSTGGNVTATPKKKVGIKDLVKSAARGAYKAKTAPLQLASSISNLVAPNSALSAGLGKLATPFAKGGDANSSDFPDLSGDGKITQKDILMGRGVIKMQDGGDPAKKSFTDYQPEGLLKGTIFDYIPDGYQVSAFLQDKFSRPRPMQPNTIIPGVPKGVTKEENFDAAFSKARKLLGPGKTFMYKMEGDTDFKTYTTDLKEEVSRNEIGMASGGIIDPTLSSRTQADLDRLLGVENAVKAKSLIDMTMPSGVDADMLNYQNTLNALRELQESLPENQKPFFKAAVQEMLQQPDMTVTNKFMMQGMLNEMDNPNMEKKNLMSLSGM